MGLITLFVGQDIGVLLFSRNHGSTQAASLCHLGNDHRDTGDIRLHLAPDGTLCTAAGGDNGAKRHAVAGKTADGKTRVLLSCHDVEDECFRIEGLSSERAVLKKIDMNFKAPDYTEGEIIYIPVFGGSWFFGLFVTAVWVVYGIYFISSLRSELNAEEKV